MPSELLKRSTVLRQTNPESGTDRPVSLNSVEPEIVLIVLIRQKGRRKAGLNEDSG